MKKVILSLIILGLSFSFGCAKNDNNSTGNNNQDNKQVAQFNPIEEKKIFGNVDTDYSWAYEPTVKNLVEHSNSVIRIKALSTDESFFLKSLNPSPLTPINVEVLEVLSGDELSSPMKIYEFGGIVSLEEVIENSVEGTAEKMGIDTLSQEEKATNYIEYSSESNYSLENGKEYIVILYKQPNGIYTLAANGYGVFETSSTDTLTNAKSKTYTNVLTGEEFNLQ